MAEQQLPTPSFAKEEMLPFFVEAGKEIHRVLGAARRKYKERYNRRNEYELMLQKFGDPEKNPEKYYDEYLLIMAKKSQLPASVRKTVDEVGKTATKRYIIDFHLKHKKKEEKQ